MTSSIFLPRRSRAWPAPSTHLMESTMFVLPDPFGPTIAVTPPSKSISVCRAKVLKPSNCRDRRNNLPDKVADEGGGRPRFDRFAELAAARLRRGRSELGLRLGLGGRREGDDLSRRDLGCLGFWLLS